MWLHEDFLRRKEISIKMYKNMQNKPNLRNAKNECNSSNSNDYEQ